MQDLTAHDSETVSGHYTRSKKMNTSKTSSREEALRYLVEERGLKIGSTLFGDSVYSWIHLGAPHHYKKVTIKQFNLKRVQRAADEFLGQFTKTSKREEGFSLIELAVSAAVLTIITGTAVYYYQTLSTNIISKIEAARAAGVDVNSLLGGL